MRELGGGRDGKSPRFWRVDVSKEAEVQEAICAVVAHFGALHVLVNNAGVAGANKPTHELTEAEWDWVQAINVKGAFFCTKHAIPLLRRAGGGSIINLSSIYGLVSAPDIPAYHASKGACTADDKDGRTALRRRQDPGELNPSRFRLDAASRGAPQGKRRSRGRRADATCCTRSVTWASQTTLRGAWSTWPRTKRIYHRRQLIIDGGYTAH